jgi:flavodoxin
MRTLVVYDSQYGNTEALARAIAAASGDGAQLRTAASAGGLELARGDLLIVGCPTQGGRPTQGIATWLQGLPAQGLDGINVAAFDTRFAAKEHGFGLRLLMRVIGFAAPRIAEELRRKGGALVMPPEGFIVQEKEGPLKSGELDRAAAWAQALVQQAAARTSARTDAA